MKLLFLIPFYFIPFLLPKREMSRGLHIIVTIYDNIIK